MQLDAYGVEGRSPWLDVDWGNHVRQVDVRGAAVNYVDFGSGDPIIFVHGHAGAWQNWLEQLPVLARSHRCVALDLPGFGRSPMPLEPVTMCEYGRTVDGLMEALGIENAALVGNSMGGFVGAETAIAFPHRVERLALVSSAGVATHYMGIPAWLSARTSGHTLKWVGPLLTPDERRLRKAMRRRGTRVAPMKLLVTHPARLSAELIFEVTHGSGPKPALAPAAVDLAKYDFKHRLPEIACPTLIVWGDRDRVVPPSGADVFERLIPDTRKVIFADTGHLPMVERPARFNQLIADFLAEEPNVDVDRTSAAAVPS